MAENRGRSDIDILLSKLFEKYTSKIGFGTLTCSVYDTAWVANIMKTEKGATKYLFPSSFITALNNQKSNGSWGGHFDAMPKTISFILQDTSADSSDAILSTMAALHMMIQHLKHPHQISPSSLPSPPLAKRIERAVESLRSMLIQWDMETCNSVGFEVLIPGMMSLLALHGYEFEFPGKKKLLLIRDLKMSRVQPQMLYESAAPLALIHSLEAFHHWDREDLDVSKLKHHMVNGSMMASPAATASYLIKSPKWDESAEEYLKQVIEYGEGKGCGAVPSAWPSTFFEVLWVSRFRSADRKFCLKYEPGFVHHGRVSRSSGIFMEGRAGVCDRAYHRIFHSG
jgi:hypothetical protein